MKNKATLMKGFTGSVGKKVCLLAITGTTLFFALLMFANWQLEKKLIYQILVDNSLVQTELLASQIVGGVRWKKPKAIWRPFEHLTQGKEYKKFNLKVYDIEGKLIIEHSGLTNTDQSIDIKNILLKENFNTRYERTEKNTVTVIAPIESSKGRLYGAMVMVWSLDKATDFLQNILLTDTFLFLTFTSVSGGFLLFVINHSVGSVLTNLSKEMVLVTENKHTSGNKFLSRKDEFGLMAKALEVFKENTSRLKKAEGNLVKKTLQLEISLKNEQQQNAMQRDFVSMTSHEFRTPIAIIDSSVQRLHRHIDTLDKEYVEKRIKKIKGATQRMLVLIDSTLSASRIEAGEIEIELGAVDLAGLLAHLCLSQQDISENHTITYDVSQLPRNMHADSAKLLQVFTNLLSNAIKYSPGASEIMVKGWIEKSRAFVTIQDFGIGISQEDWGKIFDRYYRSSNTTGISGTGIGLCLVLTLLELQGGRVSVESEVNVGSIFKVQLPINAPGDQVAEVIDHPLISGPEIETLDQLMNTL
ncbi:MAG: HAMP domain-containing sensor histidine kinase [Halopseudomonas aestusnigri]